MASVYNDLNRPPLNETRLQRALMVPGLGFGGHSVAALRVLPEVDSTNTALLAAAADGAPHGSVVVAEAQTAGRGRLGRTWVAPPRSGLFLSVLLRPDVPSARWGWLPLLAGVAVHSAVARVAHLDVALKWPNDLIVPGPDEPGPDVPDTDAPSGYGAGRKLGGILAEQGGAPSQPCVVVGIGINVTLREEELPAPHATSLVLAGAEVTDRDTLLRAVLRGFGSWYADWAESGGDAERCGLAAAYRAVCATLDRPVRAELPGGAVVTGQATGIDPDGRLLIRTADGTSTPIGAGDVVHLR
ncbi:biotin--[acetyl-CoA-carboxylase] ligase [Actinocrinis puniceicyclus]|uniref:biotin--[biotin carboxyl-carrier protein] ligase n=1 Tax=Actinocrinis puniceicyclus TaxID=977794 RepID=A0A8J7WGM6_9ACTN|nr:biotin--[acetyl-CoA-carboxylase] ligase [Actinocrinis puniceicyclus]MBS2961781.1 biotin--[acetyl-CoA-carboxylase] ligase [Actinocrinis puniceicyclus]